MPYFQHFRKVKYPHALIRNFVRCGLCSCVLFSSVQCIASGLETSLNAHSLATAKRFGVGGMGFSGELPPEFKLFVRAKAASAAQRDEILTHLSGYRTIEGQMWFRCFSRVMGKDAALPESTTSGQVRSWSHLGFQTIDVTDALRIDKGSHECQPENVGSAAPSQHEKK